MKFAFFRRRWLDFRQGHGMYLIFAMSFANFILIFYRLLIERIEILGEVFSSLWIFTLVFVISYVPIAILIGFWHRKTQIKVESELGLRQNPFMARNFRMLVDMIERRASKEEIEKFRNFLTSIEAGKAGIVKKSKKKDSEKEE